MLWIAWLTMAVCSLGMAAKSFWDIKKWEKLNIVNRHAVGDL